MYHQEALERLDKAEAWLKSDDPDALRYAALDLRMAIEHWFYDIRASYIAWIPEEIVRKWQPHQIMKAILEVDPSALTDKRLAIGAEGTDDYPSLVINSPKSRQKRCEASP